ncbi:MAG: hypothetical protein ACRDSF_19490 [Pseudonocardiaceae bacterium]
MVYVEELVGPDTVNTMPEATLDAFRDHGRVRPRAVLDGLEDTEATLAPALRGRRRPRGGGRAVACRRPGSLRRRSGHAARHHRSPPRRRPPAAPPRRCVRVRLAALEEVSAP